MKASKKFVKNEILCVSLDKMHLLQFAYRAGMGVVGCCLHFILHTVQCYVDSVLEFWNFAQLLLIDFSSASNLIQPNVLAH